MTVVSNDPSWWRVINFNIVFSYFAVASCAAVIYDWALTFGQEFELVWRQRWSLVTLLYLGVRYLGISYTVIFMLQSLPTAPATDVVSNVMYSALTWMTVVTNAMLGVIIITRLHVMYQQSRKILVFLVVILLVVTITCGVIAVIGSRHTVGEETIFSGTYQCTYHYEGDTRLLYSMAWTLYTVWEVLALCLAVWIVVKHFRALHRQLPGWTMVDCFTVLIKTHMVYFASFIAVSCFQLGVLSPGIMSSSSVGVDIYGGILEFVSIAQMFVLGPRLILSIREFSAELVADSDAGIEMATIIFEEPGDVPTDGDV
ncbi:uncharacterized protein EDB91DRAFT_1347615 [Suillus paluster]|uniref:uncharacterized protein n=1 Tax=Suillus paluster TaxID=48578 RepID=UPI001B88408F|nr:uncharacterized protein EDB91DRAFT_1347615 [Suillus paluster]KAG1738347.1 hypothetical protein EDB91DRAFT_1347615 [Suillus paluster]